MSKLGERRLLKAKQRQSIRVVRFNGGDPRETRRENQAVWYRNNRATIRRQQREYYIVKTIISGRCDAVQKEIRKRMMQDLREVCEALEREALRETVFYGSSKT